jgi:hypothetical protein
MTTVNYVRMSVQLPGMDEQTYQWETRLAPPAAPVNLNEMTDDQVEELIERAVWLPVTYAQGK